MAEERIIDDDKDRDKDKKFRILFEGEEQPEESDEEEEEQAEYEYEDSQPEEERAVPAYEIAHTASARELMQRARELYAAGDAEGALEVCGEALRTGELSDEVYMLRAELLTEGFERADRAEELTDCAEGCRTCCNAEQRAELAKRILPLLKRERDAQLAENERLKKQSEREKAERMPVLAALFSAAKRNALIAAIPPVVALVAGAVFASLTGSGENTAYYALTIVFFCIFAVALAVEAFLVCKAIMRCRAMRFGGGNAGECAKKYVGGMRRAELLDRACFLFADGVHTDL